MARLTILRSCLSVALAAVLMGCSDDPFRINWDSDPQESVVYSLDVEQLGVPTAYDMAGRRAVVIENPALEGDWDFAVDGEGDGLVFLPAGALGVASHAGIAVVPNTSFDDLTRAPADTTVYVTDEPVPVEVGTVYVVRTHEQRETTGFGRICSFYGKLEPLEVDLELGRVRFLQDSSPECNDRGLVPDS